MDRRLSIAVASFSILYYPMWLGIGQINEILLHKFTDQFICIVSSEHIIVPLVIGALFQFVLSRLDRNSSTYLVNAIPAVWIVTGVIVELFRYGKVEVANPTFLVILLVLDIASINIGSYGYREIAKSYTGK